MDGKLSAIKDRVFIRVEKPKSAAGLILEDDVQNPPNTGTVESVGELVKSVKVGDKVAFHTFDELETPIEGVVAVREYSLLGVFDDE